MSRALNEEFRKILLETARLSIRHGVTQGQRLTLNLSYYRDELVQKRASFVTLYAEEQLRGCIGTLEARQPLILDVCENAYNAAFSDPRFPQLMENEVEELQIKISVLTKPERVFIASEKELLEVLRPGIDGLVLEDGMHRGTFLPSVWESLQDPQQFLWHLKEKAGLERDYWSNTLVVKRYETESFP